MVRAGLIGCGFISQQHIPAWQASPDAELVAVCDANRARAEERAHRFGISTVYDDVETMLANEQLDCVDIATRPESHKALATLAAERNVNVLCQKPLAPTMAEGREIAAICARAGVRFMVLEMWRHLPVIRDLKRQLDAGLIGPVHSMRLLGHRRPMNRFAPVNPDQPYFAEMPKLLIYEMMIHYIDGIRYLMGDVGHVFARAARVNPLIEGDDHALVVFGHTSGAYSMVDCSWASPADRRPKMGAGDMLLEGRDGSLHLDPFETPSCGTSRWTAPSRCSSGTRARRIRIRQPSIAASATSQRRFAMAGRSSRRARTTSRRWRRPWRPTRASRRCRSSTRT